MLIFLIAEPSSNSSKSYIIYHPLNGQCVKVNNNNELELGDCDGQSKWNQEGQQIKLVGNDTCIEAISDGSQVKLSNDCKSKQSFWKTLSATNLHLSTWMNKDKIYACKGNHQLYLKLSQKNAYVWMIILLVWTIHKVSGFN